MTQDARAFNWDSIPVKTGVTADPAAGADLADITVPAGKKWLLLGGYCSIVMDANAATRYLNLQILTDGTNIHSFFVGNPMTANNTYYVSEVPVGAVVAASTTLMNGFGAPIELLAGAIIKHSLLSKQVGDNITVYRYTYKEAPA